MVFLKHDILTQRLSIVLLIICMMFSSCSIAMSLRNGVGQKEKTHKRKNYKKLNAKNDHSKLRTKVAKHWSLLDLFRDEQKRRELKCPDNRKSKKEDKGKFKDPSEEMEDAGASVKRFTRSIHFDIIELEMAHLDVPAFKQFKNNMTDFTVDGEEQFKTIIQKIRDFLGTNTQGHGITLKIIGSASQIPTSYNPSLPNNNINEDGSSIYGKTSIENNKALARARAVELAKKIKEVFSFITIETPTLEEITLGETVWDESAKQLLVDAHINGDFEAKQLLFEPYQKEQFVKVESQDSYMKTVKPEAIDMFMVSVRPKIVYDIVNGQEKTISSFIVSKETYNRIGGTLCFESVEERDAHLKSMGLNRIYDNRHGGKRWFLYGNSKELKAIEMEDDMDRIYAMYEIGLVDEKDKELLEEIIIEKYLTSHKKNN